LTQGGVFVATDGLRNAFLRVDLEIETRRSVPIPPHYTQKNVLLSKS